MTNPSMMLNSSLLLLFTLLREKKLNKTSYFIPGCSPPFIYDVILGGYFLVYYFWTMDSHLSGVNYYLLPLLIVKN